MLGEPVPVVAPKLGVARQVKRIAQGVAGRRAERHGSEVKDRERGRRHANYIVGASAGRKAPARGRRFE